MNRFVKVLASGFGLGYIPYAPGTFGTLAGIPLFLLLARFSPIHYILSLVAIFIFSCFIAKKAEILFNKKDSANIVIDEVTGFIVTMARIEPSHYSVMLGFIFFRFFDIVKVYPANFFNRMQGGTAIVLDDVIAGIYANILLRITLKYVIPYLY